MEQTKEEWNKQRKNGTNKERMEQNKERIET